MKESNWLKKDPKPKRIWSIKLKTEYTKDFPEFSEKIFQVIMPDGSHYTSPPNPDHWKIRLKGDNYYLLRREMFDIVKKQ